jgi:hypothetical protein
MLRLVHQAFPLAALWDYRHVLLGSGDSKPPINGRTFYDRPNTTFSSGLKAFMSATVEPEPEEVVGYSGEKLVFRPGQTGKLSAFVSPSAREVEVDCLLMLPPPADTYWDLQNIGQPGRDMPFFICHNQGCVRALPPSQHPPAERSDFSQEHYPPNSTMYVVGEVYHPITKSAGISQSVQKLVQIERILQILRAREGSVPVESCVLGVVFMGPHMCAEVGEAMSKALEAYRSRLPCLWRLQQQQRFIALKLAGYFPAVAALHQAEAMAELRAGLTEVRAGQVELSERIDVAALHQTEAMAELRAGQVLLSERIDQIVQRLALVLERLPPPGPPQQVPAALD